MDGILIRESTAQDAEAIGEIARAAWEPIFDGYKKQLGEEIFRFLYPEDPLKKKQEEVKKAACGEYCYVAEYEGRVVGFATYLIECNGKLGVLANNAVSMRGHGIAGLLHERIFEEMKKRGCTAVRVRTGLDEAHAPARRAYEKDGFTNTLSDITYFKML
jgi:GNAT superfamily N-acetyltransferase